MNTVKRAAAGATRTCPHCRTVILQSANVCPNCRKHLRFDPEAAKTALAAATFTPLRVEGSIRHPDAGEAWEYSVVVAIRNEHGEELSRHIVGVGALDPGQTRSFSFSVEVVTPHSRPVDA